MLHLESSQKPTFVSMIRILYQYQKFSLLMKLALVLFSISIISLTVLFATPVLAEENSKIPSWIKGIADWWVKGNISDDEFLEAIEFLINEDMIKIKSDEVSTIQSNSITSSDCPIDTFLDVENYDGAGDSYPKPHLDVYCDDEFVYVNSNGIPHYTFVQTTPNALSEQDYLWEIPLNPKSASQTSEIPLLGLVGFSVNGLPIYGPNEGAHPDPYGDPVYNDILDSCLGHTAQRGDYHYHAFELSCLALNIGNYKESPILGYALDGFPIYGPYGCVDDECSEIIEFQSSWVKTGDPTTYAWDNYNYVSNDNPVYLDECNGRYDEKLGYHYRATENFPYLLGCYAGEVSDTVNQTPEIENNIQTPQDNLQNNIPAGCPMPGDPPPRNGLPPGCPLPNGPPPR